MAIDTRYLWAGIKARTRVGVQNSRLRAKALLDRLRYGAKDPKTWNENFGNLKKLWKSQTRSVEEKNPNRLVRKIYMPD
jgi:hypothetical protein